MTLALCHYERSHLDECPGEWTITFFGGETVDGHS